MAFSAIRSALQSWAAGQTPTLSHAIQSLQPPPQGRHVNGGFVQLLSRAQVWLRVHERDAGEKLACGSGACAAVVAGIRLGWLDRRVDVHTRGDHLLIEWPHDKADVLMADPAQSVFEAEFEL